MCGRRRGASWLLSALLLALLQLSSWADAPPVYDGPELPEGWYPIHETELTALAENSETIGLLTISLRTMFETTLSTVDEWQTASTARTTRIETSLNESAGAVEALEAENAAIRTELWVYRIGGGAVLVWVLYQVGRAALTGGW